MGLSPRLFGTSIVALSDWCFDLSRWVAASVERWLIEEAWITRVTCARSIERQRHASKGARLGGVRFQFREVREQFLLFGPALQVETDHFVGP